MSDMCQLILAILRSLKQDRVHCVSITLLLQCIWIPVKPHSPSDGKWGSLFLINSWLGTQEMNKMRQSSWKKKKELNKKEIFISVCSYKEGCVFSPFANLPQTFEWKETVWILSEIRAQSHIYLNQDSLCGIFKSEKKWFQTSGLVLIFCHLCHGIFVFACCKDEHPPKQMFSKLYSCCVLDKNHTIAWSKYELGNVLPKLKFSSVF